MIGSATNKQQNVQVSKELEFIDGTMILENASPKTKTKKNPLIDYAS